jgi:hypothetical protein
MRGKWLRCPSTLLGVAKGRVRSRITPCSNGLLAPPLSLQSLTVKLLCIKLEKIVNYARFNKTLLWKCVVLALLATQVSCRTSLPHRLGEREAIVGTTGEDDWMFHRIIEEPFALGLHFPGYLVALQNTSRTDIGLSSSFTDGMENQAGYPLQLTLDDCRLSKSDREKIENCLDKSRRGFVSHVVRYSIDLNRGLGAVKPETVYSVYGDLEKDIDEDHILATKEENYVRGIKALEELQEKLRDDIEKGNVTHLFLYSMGWQTDQQEALRNYNSLYGNILEIASSDPDGKSFRPLIVGLTWDSAWLSRVLPPAASYPRKADHADELGAIWGNLLLRKVLVPLKMERQGAGHPLGLVLIGHSFGARLLTRSLFSYPVLAQTSKELVEPSQIDLVIGLQGAFSVNRFIDQPNSGTEGAPYQSFASVAKKFVFTWSKHDTANPLAQRVTHAAHIGGVPGYKRTLKFPKIFEQSELDGKGMWIGMSPDCDNQKISIVDASRVAKHATFRKGGGAHSDIYSRETAQLVWNLLKACTAVSQTSYNPSVRSDG